ncbi:XRE family transcriptional regulator [Desulfoluna butyratoxydans]|uniref:Peptidase s24/s26a/s26b/s26c n=1 Tax=Desulfoluna butyratoxydans TaxID=231438 RepID=A0A4U8YGI0_9BACT|nr:S24 family peptidase [Desulfoluna butyratoxydans]VFQ42465.1 peptidase s24/s26a/s26b/s26c [Desulfoluna butyratoxydans]
MKNNEKNSQEPYPAGSKGSGHGAGTSTGNQEFGDRLKMSREKLGLSQAGLGKKIGVTTTTVQNYEYGGSPKGDVLVRMAEVLGCSLDWLLLGQGTHGGALAVEGDGTFSAEGVVGRNGGEFTVPVLEEPNTDNYNWVPMVEAELSAGGGSLMASERIRDYYAFRKRFIANIATSPKNLVLMRVSGDSMDPEIRNGATVMIDLGRRKIKNNCIFALGFEDTIIIKELERLPEGRVRIISKNRDEYPAYEAEANSLRIIGQVIWGDRLYPI